MILLFDKKHFIVLFYVLFLTCSCSPNNQNNQSEKEASNSVGIMYGESDLTVKEAFENLKTIIQENENISIIAEIDHTENARKASMELEPTLCIFFGNPQLGTPLMQENQLVGLDLPQKVLFFEENEKVYAIYNSREYFDTRYDLPKLEASEKIAKALQNLVSNAIKNEINASDKHTVEKHQGITTVKSKNNFKETYAKLKAAISQNVDLNLVAELDHQANAASVNMQLRPTKLIMFGNPQLGTAFMQDFRNSAIDLPQKMLVWEDKDGSVNISYSHPEFLKDRHSITDGKEKIQQIAIALENLAKTGSGD